MKNTFIIFILLFSYKVTATSVVLDSMNHPLCHDRSGNKGCSSVSAIDFYVKSNFTLNSKIYSEIFGLAGELLFVNKKYSKSLRIGNPREKIISCKGCIGVQFVLEGNAENEGYNLYVNYYGDVNSESYFLGTYSDDKGVIGCVKNEVINFFSGVYSTSYRSEYQCFNRKN